MITNPIWTQPVSANQPHGSLLFAGRLFFSTNTFPAKLIRMSPSDPGGYIEIEFPADGRHNNASDMVAFAGMLYIVFYTFGDPYVKVSEVDPDTLIWRDVIYDEIPQGGSVIAPSLCIDGTYLYTTGGQYSERIFQYSLADWSRQGEITVGGSAHCIRSDGEKIYVTGASTPSWIARIDPISFQVEDRQDLSYTFGVATDDMALTPTHIFVGTEAQAALIRVEKANLGNADVVIPDGIDPSHATCYGCAYDGTWVWAVFARGSGNSALVRIDKDTLATAIFDLPLPYVNEILDDGTNLYLSTYGIPATIFALSKISLQPPPNPVPAVRIIAPEQGATVNCRSTVSLIAESSMDVEWTVKGIVVARGQRAVWKPGCKHSNLGKQVISATVRNIVGQATDNVVITIKK